MSSSRLPVLLLCALKMGWTTGERDPQPPPACKISIRPWINNGNFGPTPFLRRTVKTFKNGIVCDDRGMDFIVRKCRLGVLIFVVFAPFMASAQKNYPPAKVSFQDFKELVQTVEPYRAQRLVDLDKFLKMSRLKGAVIFDSRSDFRFNRIHIKGARHLSFTDFTQENLAKVIPSFETTVLIYCNNNFKGNEIDFATKIAGPSVIDPVKLQMMNQERPKMMALNIPTYVNLYGYGYRNVYELDELVDVNDSRIAFQGSIVSKH
jgi:hypothetical protein